MPWRGSPQGTCSVLSMQGTGGWVWWEHPGGVGSTLGMLESTQGMAWNTQGVLGSI